MTRYCFALLLAFLSHTAVAQLPVLQWAGAFVNDNEYNYDTYNNGRSVSVDAAGWDGRSPAGTSYPAGSVFVWQCTCRLAGRASENQKGTLVLIR